jgi:predicted ribosomally synthesized peptide with nif11-like leader
MSKNQVFDFFALAAKNEELGQKMRSTQDPQQLLEIARAEGFDFSRQELEEALKSLHESPNFFRKLADAVLEVFSPNHDNYPSIGVQPYEGDIDR